MMAGWTGRYLPDVPVDVTCRPARIEYRLRDAAVPGAGRLLGLRGGQRRRTVVGIRPAGRRHDPRSLAAGSSPHAHRPLVRTESETPS